MNRKRRVLVLGSSGMLGSMVFGYLRRRPSLEVRGARRTSPGGDEIPFDVVGFLRGNSPLEFSPCDFIVNCIGIIKPYCKDNDQSGVTTAIMVNALFPHKLGAYARERGINVLQIATDCVYSGRKGAYREDDPHDPLDVYGKTKSLGEVFDGSVLNIRCSIIGPEKKGKVSLLEWFLQQPQGSELKGFSHHRWNGVTTLQFAELCRSIIEPPGRYEQLIGCSPIHHFTPNETVTKYEILLMMAETFGREHRIVKVDDVGPPIDRTLSSKYSMINDCRATPQTMVDTLKQLKRYIDEVLY